MKTISIYTFQNAIAAANIAADKIPASHCRKKVIVENETFIKELEKITKNSYEVPEESLINKSCIVLYVTSENLGSRRNPEPYKAYQTQLCVIHHFSEKSLFFGSGKKPDFIPKSKILAIVL